jgi:hypothetical protein
MEKILESRIEIGDGLDFREIVVRFLAGIRDSFLLQIVQTVFWDLPSLLFNGCRGLFP